jgi:NADH-quinone oxidoreductase subunit N
MSLLLAASHLKGPHIDFKSLSPLLALAGGGTFTLLIGLFGSRFFRAVLVPLLTIAAFGAFIGLTIWRFHHSASIISDALRVDDLAFVLNLLLGTAGIATVLLAWRSRAVEEAGHGELHSLLLFCVMGMAVLVSAQNTITLFLGYELLSIPLYVLCASELRTEQSLESGLKYLIVGSVGSATLVYGLALIYGATGTTDFGPIGRAISTGDIATDPLLLTGVALVLVGLAFKASVAPFHQWTPDVYEGAPTPITAFMAVATKVAALGVFLRFFDTALIGTQDTWGPALAALATITIVVGNVGALGQSSLKRMLAWSSVAQAGYMLGGVVVGTQLGIKATVFYLAVYMAMNLAAFAVIVARERETMWRDDIRAVSGLGAARPILAWPLTIAMLSLAGIPATAGFIGKIYLIDALVDGNYAWLGVIIVVGSMISLAYYLRVVAAMWMRDVPEAGAPVPATRPAIAGAEQAAETARYSEVALVAVVAGAASIVLGIVPGPLFHLVGHAGKAIGGLF